MSNSKQVAILKTELNDLIRVARIGMILMARIEMLNHMVLKQDDMTANEIREQIETLYHHTLDLIDASMEDISQELGQIKIINGIENEMPIEPTDKSKYQSPTTGEYCTDAQYIAEILTVRQAKKEGVNVRYKFWNHKPWSTKYRYNVTEAYKILKQYSAKAVIAGIQEESWAYSLKAKKLLACIKKHHVKLTAVDQRLEETKPLEVNKAIESVPIRRGRRRKNVIALLREMENGKRKRCDPDSLEES